MINLYRYIYMYLPINYLVADPWQLYVLLKLSVTEQQQKELPPQQYGKAFHDILIHVSHIIYVVVFKILTKACISAFTILFSLVNNFFNNILIIITVIIAIKCD